MQSAQKRLAVGATVLLFAGLLALSSASKAQTRSLVEVAQLTPETWDDFAPDGKEADAIYGDFVLRNRHLQVVIAAPLASRHANMGVKDVAGCVIDFANRNTQNDQLCAFYPGKKVYKYRELQVCNGKREQIQLGDSHRTFGPELGLIVKAEGSETKPETQVMYSLAENDLYLTVTTRFTNKTDKPMKVTLEDDFRADGQKEDMVRSPNGQAEWFWLHDRYWNQAYGIEAPSYKLNMTSDPKISQIRYENADGKTEVTLAANETFELVRRLFAAENAVQLRAVVQETHGQPTIPGQLLLRDSSGRPLGKCRVDVARNQEAYGSLKTDADGRASLQLPPGDYTFTAQHVGVVVVKEQSCRVPEEGSFQFELRTDYHPGTVVGNVVDSTGQPIPCKISFTPQGDTPNIDFGPVTAEFAVKNVLYTANGAFRQDLAPGKYEVVVSHGPEFDAHFTTITVAAGQVAEINAKLPRTVDTSGWVSGDFHSHSSPSGDNTSSQLGRVLNLVCEHVEFAPCTEHNRVSTYLPHIQKLNIAKHFATVSGIELTGSPLPLNHQNAFPMILRRRTQDGGGPLNDLSEETQIERLAKWDNNSEKLIQQNHPDIGWLFYDKNGDGKPDAGHDRAFQYMNVMEIHPIQDALDLKPLSMAEKKETHNNVFNWLQLLNQGFRVYGVVNTDAHYNWHGSGWLRNWIQSSTDDPARIDSMEMVQSAKLGRMTMSNGPFLDVYAKEKNGVGQVTCGGDLVAKTGKVVLRIRVQCPNWLDVDRVVVLVNGRPHPVHNYQRAKDGAKFSGGVVKFDHDLDLELKQDAHLVVVAGDTKGNLVRVMGKEYGNIAPTALSNPIFIDIDGNGFQPNKDTLDHPLPVKHPGSK